MGEEKSRDITGITVRYSDGSTKEIQSGCCVDLEKGRTMDKITVYSSFWNLIPRKDKYIFLALLFHIWFVTVYKKQEEKI